jgi:hypothetical protein
MSPRGGTRKPTAPTPPEQALARSVERAVKSAVSSLGGYYIGVSISIATDEEGRPAGLVMATKTPRPAQVEDAIDVTPEQVSSAEGDLAKKEG